MLLLAAVGTAAVLSACGSTVADVPLHPVALRAPLQAADPAAADTPAFTVPVGEEHRAAKQAAVVAAERLTTYARGEPLTTLVARVTTDPARQRALQTAALPLWDPQQSSQGSIVYPQLGGYVPGRASVMVVVRQELTDADGTRHSETRVLDVRVLQTPRGWAFDGLGSAGGTPVARPAALPALAAAVVDNPRITLPDSARWDIYRGRVAPALLQLLSDLAARTPFAVTVLETGHPLDVFGTTHRSAHSVGHAADVYALGGTDVIDQRVAGSRAYDAARWAFSLSSVDQVGSPWNFDGSGRRSFTNDVHQDHLHLAVR